MTCGGGVQNRSRTCTNSPAQFGGKLCPGESDETRVCNEDSCPSKFLLCFDALMLGIGYFNRPVTIWSFSISLSVVPVETECLVSLVIGLTGSTGVIAQLHVVARYRIEPEIAIIPLRSSEESHALGRVTKQDLVTKPHTHVNRFCLK